MNERKENFYSLFDLVHQTRNFLSFLFKKWWVLLLAALVGVLVGILYHSYQKPRFEATTTFILEDKAAGGGGGLAGLASQFGLNIGGGGSGGSIFGGDNILSILQSKRIVQQVLLTRVDSTGNGSTKLADLYLDFTGTKNRWRDKPDLAKVNFADSKQLTVKQDSVLNVIYEAILKNNLATERTSKQGTIIKVQVTASNAVFAKIMTERLVSEASKLYMNIRTGTLEANIEELQSRSDSLLMLLNRKSFIAAASQPLDINPAMRTASVPVEIATRDKTVLATLYAEVTKNLEASRVLLSQETPVIQMLDVPGLSLKDNQKSKLFDVLVGTVCLMMITVLSLGLLYVIDHYSERPNG